MQNLKIQCVCSGNRPIADFFHDQTICITDCENFIISPLLSSEFYQNCGQIVMKKKGDGVSQNQGKM